MDSFEDRAREGEALAPALGGAGVEERLLRLLLDPEDTAVTYRTARALLARGDDTGVVLVVRASAAAEGTTTAEWLGAAFLDLRADSLGAVDGFLHRSLGVLEAGADGPVRTAAAEVRRWLGL